MADASFSTPFYEEAARTMANPSWAALFRSAPTDLRRCLIKDAVVTAALRAVRPDIDVIRAAKAVK